MNDDQYFMISLAFYIIQHFAIIFYFLKLLPLRENNRRNKILVYLCMMSVIVVLSYFFKFNFLMKLGVTAVSFLLILHFFCEGKLFTKILYFFLSVGIQFFDEILILGICILVFQIDILTLSSIDNILLVYVPATTFISFFHIFAAKLLSGNEIDGKQVVGLSVLLLTQSLLVIAVLIYLMLDLSFATFVFLSISVLPSYFLFNSISTYIYEEFKYKENTLYFIRQYEAQMHEYVKLKDSEEEVCYLRHEIMNQLLNYQEKQGLEEKE